MQPANEPRSTALVSKRVLQFIDFEQVKIDWSKFHQDDSERAATGPHGANPDVIHKLIHRVCG